MSSKSLYSEDYFVLLFPGEAERILSAAELIEQLKVWIAQYPDAIGTEIRQQTDLNKAAEALRDSRCELELESGRSAQWYAIRLEK